MPSYTLCLFIQAHRNVSHDGGVEGDSGDNACEFLYGVYTGVSFTFSEDGGRGLRRKARLFYDNCVIAYVGGGISARDGWVSAVVRRLDGSHNPESGISALASVSLPSEEVDFCGALYSG